MKILQKILCSQKRYAKQSVLQGAQIKLADLAMLLDGKGGQIFPWHR